MKYVYIPLLTIVMLIIASPLGADWNPFKKDKKEETKVDNKVAETIATFKRKDPDLKKFFSEAYGYAVFPTVGKGGMGIGGAYGKGEVYQNGKRIGTTSLTQLSIGFQLGGQAYSEMIFFKDKKALEQFTSGSYKLSAQASAVAIKAGASTNAVYDNGLAIFTMAKGGLMYEASVAGQKFSYDPLETEKEEKK
ncbi:MAG: lipid-binding SYLF domain-containing protein [Candidatus Latescibacterota bacterium]|jgi:lipid-binding SYLF domain-containing protein